MKTRFHWLFASFLCLFLTHVVVFVFYILHHQHAIRASHQSNIAQEVMNVVHMIQATPEDQLHRAIKTIENPHLKVSLSLKPIYAIRAKEPSFWDIKKIIITSSTRSNFSIWIKKEQWLNVEMTIAPIQSIWPNLIMLFAELFIAGIVLFYAWSINRFIVPLKDFQMVAQGLGIALKTTMLKNYKGPRVIQETAQAMNQMQQRIKDLVNDRTLMLAAISHDLKTPITRLKLRAHLLDNVELRQEVLRDLDEMETMITELLIFSKNENVTEHRQKLELNSFIETICHELSDMNYDVTFHRMEKRVVYECRKVAFKRSLNNIIQNAVKYGKKADVYLESMPDTLLIHVDDQGPGMDEAEFEKVFSPFYRLDHSRSRNIAGTGLGLAIARSAIRSHGGDISLSNRQAGGLRVTFSLPL